MKGKGMNSAFIQSQNGKIIIDQAQLVTYGILAIVAVVVLVVIIFALKHRKKNFIKTVPTNLKDGE